MKKLLPILLLISTMSVMAQKDAPGWMDPVTRANKYSDEEYLTAMQLETLGKKANLVKKYEKLNEAARTQLIQSVIVSINSSTEMNVNIENTKTDEKFNRKSVSFTVGDLVGLNVKNYYDQKKRIAYSFAYVAIEELKNYYGDVMVTKGNAVDVNAGKIGGLISSGDKLGAIKLIYENEAAFVEMDKASQILVALGQSAIINFDNVSDQKLRNRKQTEELVATGVNIDELALLLANDIILQVTNQQLDAVGLGLMEYQSSGVESEFSAALKNKVFTTLAATSKLKLVEEATDDQSLKLQGFIDSQNENAVTSVSISDKAGGVFASAEQIIPMNSLQVGNLTYLPLNFDKLSDLANYSVTHPTPEVSIKPDDVLKSPLSFSITFQGNALSNVPLSIEIKNEEEVIATNSVKSNEGGVADYYLPAEQIVPGNDYIVSAQVDVAGFLNLDAASDYYQTLRRAYSITPITVKANYLSPTIFVRTKESSFEGPLSVPVISPAVKGALADLNYDFTDNVEEADYIIEIQALSRTGQSSQMAHIAYVDATISMIQRSNGKEIYKNAFSNVKGIGTNFSVASSQAFMKAKSSVVDDISYTLEYKK